ncbi:cation transporter [Chitinophagaceae bacterium 26-R-25]|nr:cation transporter [Chitinophagaceae bacterium 26-R-25]
MNTFKFKTNINCSGCVAAVTPALNEVAGKDNWNVDTQNPSKILTVTTDLPGEKITTAVINAGYKIEALS